MPKNNYEVRLSSEEVKKLKNITHKGANASAKTIMHANILLNTNTSSFYECDFDTVLDFTMH